MKGRPSPARQKAARRRSLDAVKAEMREGNMRSVQAPGKVQDRVRQWQKNGAAVAIADPNIDEIVIIVETDSDDGPDEADRLRVKNGGKRKSKSPIPEERTGRRRTQEGKENTPTKEPKNEDERPRSKSVAPKKRVISDSHWMKNKRSPPRKTTAIPKNFLQATATNPPVERKIEDWVRRTTETVEIPVKIQTPKRKPKKMERDDSEEPPSRKASKSPCDDGIRTRGSKLTSRDDSTRIRPSKDRPAEDSSWVTSSRGGSNDDGIRIKPSDVPEDEIRVKFSKPRSYDDDMRVRLSKDNSVQEDVQIKQVRKDGSKRRPKGENESPTPTPRKKSETHLKPPTESEGRSRVSSHATLKTEEEDDKFSWASPSPPEKSKRKNRKSDTNTATESLDEIPVGNSAFSVLDLALGAEPDIVKRPTPKRNPSFGVPKVLKKVYNEGMKIMHDNHEPARGGPNQPPSIDSWLNGTSDPFTDGTVPTDDLGISNSYPSRMPSYKEDDKSERELSHAHPGGRLDSRRRPSMPKVDEDAIPAVTTPVKARDTLLSMDHSPPISPGGLKRTLATHKTASPKAGRKLFSKEGIFDAFKGESAMVRKKDDAPSPFDFIGLREQDLHVSPQGASTVDSGESVSEEPQRKVSTKISESPNSVGPNRINMSSFPRRPGPMTGANRLSTIASVETFETLSSVTTESQLSETTVTQDTLLTAPTLSSLSRGSTKPRRKRSAAKTVEKSKLGSKRGLTKHSDLLSMLSLPDTTQPGRANSIRPARSVRTNRVNLETATVQDLMREVAEDETKYMRELNTLVDGVIPVLLTCVLSKNDAAIAAGLFNPLASSSIEDPSFTKPIVDMGIALERLKSLHKRIPLADSEAFLYWAESAQKTYREYLVAWRTGFQDVVVNLEPASPSSSPQKMDGEMRRDKNGDVIRDNGERADVAYLLKRPLVRVKFLARATKGLDAIKKSKQAKEIREIWDKLEIFARSRAKEEAGRREDLDAASTDPTRARDLKTMAPVEGVRVDPSLQVIAKDTFSLDIRHSSGQRMECQVEFILRNSPDRRFGDVLICAFDNTHRYLLFPPISKSRLSCRKGDSGQQLIVMIRNGDEEDHWQELLILGTDDDEASGFWIKELGTIPLVPAIPEIDIAGPSQALLTATPSSALTVPIEHLPTTAPIPTSDDVPIGQRRRREEEGTDSPSPRRLPSYRRRGPVTNGYDRLGEEVLRAITEYNVLDFNDLNDAMTKAGYATVKKLKPRGPNPTKRATPSRYHKPKDTLSSNDGLTLIDMSGDKNFLIEMSGALDLYPEEVVAHEEFGTAVDHRAGSPDYSLYDCMDLPYIPKKRASSASSVSDQPSTPLRETMRPEIQSPKKRQLDTPAYADSPPPVPAHRTPSTPDILKKIPVIETPTPRNKNRRGSSPLKHEYQPSEESGASGTSSCDDSESESDSSTASSGSYSDSSDDELEAIDEEEISIPVVLPRVESNRKRPSPEGSVYSIGAESLAPSNSASQGPYTTRVPSNGTIVDPLSADVRKFAATVSFWNGKKGKWEDIYAHPDQTCSIQVSPGLVQAFQIDSDHSSPNRNVEKEGQKEGPVVALGLTPLVPLRKSTMIDIEVTSPPLESSRLKQSPTVRFRTMNERDCESFYQALHRARLDNPAWKKLEMDRTLASYGNHAYENAVAPSRRSWFGRKKSYRAPDRAPSEIASEQSGNSSPSALSALRRLGGGGLFNIAKSSIHDKRSGGRGNPSSGPTSMYTTESSEYSSGVTSPHSPSLANSGSMYSNGLAVRNIGSENLKIRLYRGATSSKWQDMGEALLTVGNPLPGQRHASSLNHGVPKRIFVVKAHPEDDKSGEDDGNSSKKKKEAVIWLDVVLGSRNFMKYGRNGIAFQIWEDITGDDGMLGGVPAIGGVSGRTRKWMFQTQRAGDCVWIYNLVGGS